jgi:hypothetical protein
MLQIKSVDAFMCPLLFININNFFLKLNKSSTDLSAFDALHLYLVHCALLHDVHKLFT